MRLLVVTQYFWPESFRINEVVESLVRQGVQVDVLTGKPNYPEGDVFDGYAAAGCHTESWAGATVHRVPLMPRGKRSGIRLALNYLSFILAALIWGPRLLRQTRPDAILVYGTSPILQAIPALVLSRLKGCPVALWVQDLWPDSLQATGYVRNVWLLGLVGWVVAFIYRRTDRILVSSRSFARSVNYYAPAQRVTYYPNSVDNSFCDPEAGEKPSVPALETGFNVVFAGNVGTAQAVGTIVEAATLLQGQLDIRFVIMGSGSQLEWVSAEIVRRHLTNLVLAGRFPVSAMPYLLSRASALLVTLTDQPIFAETVPNKVQAYMAVGRPILACLNGEGASLVEVAGAGIAVPAEDASALAAAILRLYRMSPTERAQLGRNGQAYFRQHFDHEMLVTALIEHMQDMCREAKDK